jgi:hypothetical protein
MALGKKVADWRFVIGSVVCIMILFFLWHGFVPVLQGRESTSPAEEHQAIAAQYRQEAAETRKSIKRHQIAADVYRKGSEQSYGAGFNPQGRKQMVQHCERVIRYYTEVAKELDAMTAEHEAVAKQLKSSEHPEGQQ